MPQSGHLKQLVISPDHAADGPDAMILVPRKMLGES